MVFAHVNSLISTVSADEGIFNNCVRHLHMMSTAGTELGFNQSIKILII